MAAKKSDDFNKDTSKSTHISSQKTDNDKENVDNDKENVVESMCGIDWGKSLEFLPTFTIKEIKKHRDASGKQKDQSVMKTMIRGRKLNSNFVGFEMEFAYTCRICNLKLIYSTFPPVPGNCCQPFSLQRSLRTKLKQSSSTSTFVFIVKRTCAQRNTTTRTASPLFLLFRNGCNRVYITIFLFLYVYIYYLIINYRLRLQVVYCQFLSAILKELTYHSSPRFDILVSRQNLNREMCIMLENYARVL